MSRGRSKRANSRESSCGTLVTARFKRGGMRWSKAGANDILRLRACVRSGLYDGFWRQRRGPPTSCRRVPGALKRRTPVFVLAADRRPPVPARGSCACAEHLQMRNEFVNLR